MDMIVKSGILVTATDSFVADIGIKNGKIANIAEHIEPWEAEVIEAKDMFVLPGAIDVHTHFQLPFMRTVSADDFVTGTKAAACGGVTSFIDFAIQQKSRALMEAVESRRKEADGKVCIDYSLHAAITDFSEATLAEIPKVIRYGIPSFKVFMIYAKEGWMADDGSLFAVLEKARDCGGLVGVHAENPFIIDYNVAKFLHEGKTEARWHGLSRPNYVEAEAISRAIYWTEITRSRLYVFHMSTKEGVQLVSDARARGLSVFAETCPQYLLLTDEKYEGEEGINYPTGPPLRKKEDCEGLWRGLQAGTISAVATDHCPLTRQQRQMGKDDFTKIPNGLPGIETLLPLVYSEGVAKGRLTMNQLVEVTSATPARLFGLYPQKGSLAIGADADIVVFDPAAKRTLSHSNLHMNLDFSPYEGLPVSGWPKYTLSRGKILARDGQFVGEEGWGRFVPRFYLERVPGALPQEEELEVASV